MSNNQNQGASIEAERAEFEAWVERARCNTEREKDRPGEPYGNTTVELMWLTWRAARRIQAARRTHAAAVGAGELIEDAKDAARYRHLRSGKWFEQGFAKTEPNASAFHYAGELLDSKVDAAMAAQQAQASARPAELPPCPCHMPAQCAGYTVKDGVTCMAKASGAMGDDLKGGEHG